MSDHKGAAIMLPVLPPAKTLIGDKGYDSTAFRAALKALKIKSCIPPRKNRKDPVDWCKATDKKHHKVENMFAKLKDRRRIAMRYDRCAHTCFSAIHIAATVIFWLD